MMMVRILILFCFGTTCTTAYTQVTVKPAQVLINRDNAITSQEVLGLRREVSGNDLFGGMYVETNGSANGKPFYGFAIDNVTRAFTYYNGADDGIHTTIGAIRQSIWRDSMQWQTTDGSQLKFYGYKLSQGKNGNTILGYQSVLTDSPNNIGNTVLGSLAAQELVSGVSNTIVGNWSGWKMTTGDFNALLGSYTGADLTSGSRNTMIGYYAGSNTNTNSTGNVFLGYRAGEDEQGSNKLYIANSETTSPLIYGDFASSSLEINGSSQFDGSMTVNGTTTINGQVNSQDINIKDNNPYLQFYQESSPKYYFQYQNSNDQFVLVEVGGGQVFKTKNGEIYFPELGGGGVRQLWVENDGRITTDKPSPTLFYGSEFYSAGSGGSQFIAVKELPNGMTLTSLECVVHCFGADPVGAIKFLRHPIAPSGSGSAEIIFELNPPNNGCGTFSTNTVITPGADVIDTNNYYYYFNADVSDAQKYSEIRLFH